MGLLQQCNQINKQSQIPIVRVIDKIISRLKHRLHHLDRVDILVTVLLFTFLFLVLINGVASAQQEIAPNGTRLMEDPFDVIFSPFTRFFERVTGNGSMFFIFPVTVIAIGVYVKTHDVVTASMFLILSGALLFSGSVMAGADEMGALFIIFTAAGVVSLFLGILFQRRSA